MYNIKRNLTMLTDFYELTMGNSYFIKGIGEKVGVFDMFFRKVPDNGGFVIMAGVEQLVQYIKDLHFDKDDIDYLRGKGIFNEQFLEYLSNFKFTCDVWAVPEGTPVFPNEPLLTVKGSLIQAQFIETMLLLTINHQCLIATKANRIVRSAKGRPVLELGARRGHGADSAMIGARASFIGGCQASATTMAEQLYGVPAIGTMAHSFCLSFPTEFEAFKAYAETYPDSTTLLVDTFNVLKSGVPNAIRVAKEVLEPKGYRLKGIRLDSGDMAYLSKECRKMLDKAGLEDCKIVASNSLDEHTIKSLLNQGAKIDIFGCGERLIVAKSEPVFGGVYKLVAMEHEEGKLVSKIKVSENVEKITNPGFKKVYRFFDKDTNKALADVITMNEEQITNDLENYEIFDQVHTWKRKTLTNFYVKELLQPIFVKGECVYKERNINEIRDYCKEQLETLWDEIKRLEMPQTYYVDLSQKLYDLKIQLLNEHTI